MQQNCCRFARAEKQLQVWGNNVRSARWKNPAELKMMYGSASILKGGRVVFNIAGNNYRLITSINYIEESVFLIWFGTHENYDKINAQEIKYVRD